jgi:glycerate 2-kinase
MGAPERAPVLVAPDSFKGTLTAPEVAAAISGGLARAGIEADPCPVADGGEGTLDVLLAARGGTVRDVEVGGPLGAPVRARVGVLDDGVAVVEAAEAIGLGLIPPQERDPVRATSRGIGELIVAAARGGASRILVAVGGTATTDGGHGAVDAVRDAGGVDAPLTVLCDVRTRFVDAARVFAPQKGADEAAVAQLADRLDALADAYPRDPRAVAGSGAGGGLSGGLWAALGAELVPGARCVLQAVGFNTRLERARSVIVGEGRLDAQTEAGKAIAEICSEARIAGCRVDAIVGRNELDVAARQRLGLASVREASSPGELEAAALELAPTLA